MTLNREEKLLKGLFFTLFCFLPLEHGFSRFMVLPEQGFLWSNPVQRKGPSTASCDREGEGGGAESPSSHPPPPQDNRKPGFSPDLREDVLQSLMAFNFQMKTGTSDLSRGNYSAWRRSGRM